MTGELSLYFIHFLVGKTIIQGNREKYNQLV